MAGRVETTRLQFEITINGERKVLKTLKEVRQERRTLIKQIETQTLTQDEYNKKIQEIAKLDSILGDHKNKIRGAGKELDAAGKSATGFGRLFQKLGPIISSSLGPISLILTAVNYLVQMTMATIRASQEMQKLRERVNQVSGLVGEDLNKAAATAQALGNTFEVDVTKGVDAANAATNAYLKEGENLGEVYQQTLDGIGARLAGLDGKGDEFLDQVAEYSVQAKKAGLEMDEFFNVITVGINRGVPTDKLIDSVKEFDTRIKTLTKGQRETLEQTFGQGFTDRIVTGIETGKLKGVDALKELNQEIQVLGEDSAAAQRVVSDIFGGPGEDATANFISLLNGVDGSLESVIDTTNRYYRDKQELFQLEKEANLVSAQLSQQLDGTGNIFKRVGLILKTNFTRFLAEAIEFIRYFPEYFSAATSSWRAWANVVLGGIEAIIFKFNPFVKLLEKITGVEFKLPRFEIEDDPYADVKKKIETDRKEFEESQRQQALIEQNKTEAAKRLAELQSQKERQNALGEMKQKEREKQAQLELEAQRKIEDLRIAAMEAGFEKEKKLLETRAKRQIEDYKGTEENKTEAKKLIEEKLQSDISILEEKYRKTKEEADKKSVNEEFQSRKEALEKYQAEQALLITQQVKLEIEGGADIEDATEEVKKRLLEKEREFLEAKKKLLEEFNQDTTQIEQQIANLDLSNLKPDPDQEEEDIFGNIIEKAELAAQAINKVSDFISAQNQARYKKDLAALEESKEKELELAGDNTARREKIEERYNKKVEELEEVQAKKSKQISLVNAIINTALSVTKALASAPPPANFVAAAINAAAGAAQIATIQAQQFAFGGILPEENKRNSPHRTNLGNPSPNQSKVEIAKEVIRHRITDSSVNPGRGGLPIGPSHQEGHIFLVDGRSGQVRGAIEGGEPILSKKTYQNNKEVIDRLLFSSMNQGGKRIYRDGGIEGSFFQAPTTTVNQEVVDNTRSSTETVEITNKLDELIGAYKQGKTVLLTEKEAEMITDLQTEMNTDKVKRAL